MGDEAGCSLLHMSWKMASRSKEKLKKIIRHEKSLQEETGESWDVSLCKAGDESVCEKYMRHLILQGK